MPGFITQLKQKSTQELIKLLFPIAAALAGGGWGVYLYFHPSLASEAATPSPTVSANNGSIAIGRNGDDSPVTVGSLPKEEK